MKIEKSLNWVTWALIALYLGYVVTSSLTTVLPPSASGWLFVPLINLVVIAHGLRMWKPLQLLGFYVWVFAVSTIIENIGVHTGLPFGNYHYTEILGPPIGVVPIAIGFSYVPAAYFCWVIAVALTGRDRTNLTWATTITRPIIASVAMVLWDLSLDPLNSTIGKAWIWEDGGAYFGVPILNFVGWFITVIAFFVPFSIFLKFKTSGAVMPNYKQPEQFWIQAVLVYVIMGLSRVLMSFTATNEVVIDAGGTAWDTAAIIQSSGLITVFTMWFLAFVTIVVMKQSRTQ